MNQKIKKLISLATAHSNIIVRLKYDKQILAMLIQANIYILKAD